MSGEIDDAGIRAVIVSENTVLQQGAEQESLKLYALSAVLIDAGTGRVLYEKDAGNAMPMASTTKIMTCILALENCSLDETVTVSKTAAAQPAVKAGIAAGETYRLGDLLCVMMLESYNDVAYAVAEHVGGDAAGFQELMNGKASEIGMENTYFITPNGLDAEDENGSHSSTAYDMALLGAYVLDNETFRSIISTRQITVTELEGKRSIAATNRDSFLDQMDGAIGIKTGFTNGAGYCFVGAVESDGRLFVSAVLGCGWPPSKTWKWSDTQSLMRFGTEQYELREITEGGRAYSCLYLTKSEDSANDAELLMADAPEQTGELMAADISENTVSLSGEEVAYSLNYELESNGLETGEFLISAYDTVTEVAVYASVIEGAVQQGQVLGHTYLYINDTLVQERALLAPLGSAPEPEEPAAERVCGAFLL